MPVTVQPVAVEWAEGFPSRGVPAQTAYKELERIRKAHDGELTAEVVAQEARKRGNVLNPLVYDRTREQAADEYYRRQAAKLIGSVLVEYEDMPDKPTRKYHLVGSKDNRGQYRDDEDAMTMADYRKIVLERAKKELASFKTKYARLRELKSVFDAIDGL